MRMVLKSWKNLSYQIELHTPSCIANQIDVDTFMNTSMEEIINLDDKKLKRRHCKGKNLKSSGKTHTINPGKNRHLWHASKRAK